MFEIRALGTVQTFRTLETLSGQTIKRIDDSLEGGQPGKASKLKIKTNLESHFLVFQWIVLIGS